MPELIGTPSRVTAAGEPPKLIDEYVGQVLSIATADSRHAMTVTVVITDDIDGSPACPPLLTRGDEHR